jgi:hypothetical protein
MENAAPPRTHVTSGRRRSTVSPSGPSRMVVIIARRYRTSTVARTGSGRGGAVHDAAERLAGFGKPLGRDAELEELRSAGVVERLERPWLHQVRDPASPSSSSSTLAWTGSSRRTSSAESPIGVVSATRLRAAASARAREMRAASQGAQRVTRAV